MTVAASSRRATVVFAVATLFAASSYFAGCGGDDSNGNGTGDGGTIDATSGDGAGVGDTGNNHPDGGSNDGACTPATVCPASYACGAFVDPCNGNVLACGMPCKSGQVCDSTTHTCTTTATACSDQHAQCGIIKDACGTIIDCGGCPMGKVCDGNQCVPPPPPSDAGQCGGGGTLTCTLPDGTNLCGTITDGCGHSMNCTCVAPATCGGGGTPGVCGVPLQCDDGGVCGTVPNSCGSGNVTCPACATGMTCGSNHHCAPTPPCVPTNPTPCTGKTCGNANNGCVDVSCGAACGAPEVCHQGNCCTPLTCADIADAGGPLSCEPIPDNCGGNLNCVQCGASDRCIAGSCTPCPTCTDGGVCEIEDAGTGCCYPESCESVSDAGCQPIDLGCGVRHACATCAGTEICQGDGTCCTPKTCGDITNPGCQKVDLGCGQHVVCGFCTTGQVCLGDGTCCQPSACDGRTGIVPDGCGGTIVCNGTK